MNEESLCKLVITILILYIPLIMFYIILFFPLSFHCSAQELVNRRIIGSTLLMMQ